MKSKCTYVCVCKGERKREREMNSEKDRQTDGHRKGKRDRDVQLYNGSNVYDKPSRMTHDA